MKSYLLVSVVLLGLALIVSIVIFIWVQSLAPRTLESTTDQLAPESGESPVYATSTIPELPALGVSLGTLPVATTTKQLLEGVGLDPSEFVITNEMANCAITNVGGERVAALAAGDTPTPREVLVLLPCVSAE